MSDQPYQTKEEGPHEKTNPEYEYALEILAKRCLELFNLEQNQKGDDENEQ